MCKALDKSIEIKDIYLMEKTGGKSGDYRRHAQGKTRGKTRRAQ
jgi:cyclic pyranopterin phosphate synthase